MTNINEMRKKLLEMQNKAQANKGEQTDSEVYLHWNLPDNGQSIVRYLPDGNANNTFFWEERQIIKLPFAGVKGNPDVKDIIVQVPCADMWGRNLCPIVREIQPWWDDASLKPIASKYWKKRSYLMQGFVVEDGIQKGTQAAPDQIKRFVMNPQIFKIVKATILDPDMENSPVDFDFGTNFKIIKTKNGNYADYATSTWMRKESALTDAQKEAVKTHGLHKLSDFLPKQPTDLELKIIHEMFEASVNGELYDLEKWGNYYKPFNLNAPSTDDDNDEKSTTTEAPAIVKTTTEEPAQEETKTTSASQSAQDILEALKRRKASA